MPAIGTGTYVVDIDTKRFESGIRSAASKAGDLAKTTTSALGAASAAALAAGAAYKVLADEVYGTVDSVNTLSQGSGLAADTVNGLRLAAKAANKDMSALFPETLIDKMQQAQNGSMRAVRGFEQIGVAVTDSSGAMRSADDVYRDTMRALFSIEDPTLRAAKANQLLGKQGREMLSAFSDVGDLERFIKLGQQFGTKVGPDAVAKSDEWWSATSALSLAFEDSKQTLTEFTFAGQTAASWVSNFALGWIYLKTALLEGTGAAAEAAEQFFKLQGMGQKNNQVTEEGAAAAAAAAGDWGALVDQFKPAPKIFNDLGDGVERTTKRTKKTTDAFTDLIGELDLVTQYDLDKILTADEIIPWARKASDEIDRLANEEVEGLIIQLGHVNDELEETAKLDFKQLAGALADIGNEVTDAMDPYADALSNMFDMADQRAEDAAAKLDKLKEKNKSIREEMRNTDDAATRASLQLELEANKVAQGQARAAARIRKQQALRAWRGEKAGNITMAIANGAVAVTQAFAQLGPIAGAFAAIGVAAATATQVGLIASQKPPQYHTGGRFGSGLSGLAGDEMQATVLRNEGAVTARGVRAAGGDKGLRELSKGRMPGGETVVHNVIQIGDRVIARETRRHTPGQLGQSNPHRR